MTKQFWVSKTYAFKYTLLGVFFGLCFPLLAWIIEFIALDLGPSLNNFFLIHQKSPVLFIVETAPFVLSFMANSCGKNMDKIKEKNKQIIRASSYKDDFLASMSHEIRTPMSGIVGVVDLLEKSLNIKDHEREYVDIIKKSSKDLMRIINDILDLSKLRSGKFVIEKKQTNIREICDHIQNLFLAISKAKNIDLVLDIDEKVPTFLVLDAVRIKQILTNLVGNALKFSSKGRVTLKVSLKDSSQDNVTLKFEVIDSGKGIAKDKVASIFNAYEQLGPDTDKNVQGTGLGLHICKSLVKLMGGKIGVESELKKGSNFWFTIIANTVPDKLHKITTEVQKEESLKKLDLHVLLVDDNRTLCKVYKRMLDDIGCQTVVAHDGEEVIELFKEGVYDIVLLDINMPIMDGMETMRYLRSNFTNLPPIICATASALKGDLEKYMEEGFDDYITKPFVVSGLYSKLSKWEPFIKPNTPKNKIDEVIK